MASYVDKQLFISDLSDAFKSILTVTDMEKMHSALLEVLSHYDIDRRNDDIDAVKASEDCLQIFIDAKMIEGRTEKTLARYKYILNQFFNTENVTPLETTVYHVRDYFMREKKRGIADSTVSGYRDILNSFFGWLTDEGMIAKNPCANIGAIKQEKKVRKPFTNVEIQKIIKNCPDVRGKAIVMFLLHTGCRISELCSIDVEDVDLRKRECIVYGKGRKERTIFFDEVTEWCLEKYIKDMSVNEGALFKNSRGERLTADGIRWILKNVEWLSGVANIHPHRFRRTFATNAINNGMSVQDVAAILGHERLDTTMKYVYQSKERTKMAYEQHAS